MARLVTASFDRPDGTEDVFIFVNVDTPPPPTRAMGSVRGVIEFDGRKNKEKYTEIFAPSDDAARERAIHNVYASIGRWLAGRYA